jgi:DNA-directed RNA polymerase sigma subunit (sigma70/sigma32)
MDLRPSLRWWDMVTTIIERETPERQKAFRLRLRGCDLLSVAKQINSEFGCKWTRERVRQIEAKMLRNIEDAMKPVV